MSRELMYQEISPEGSNLTSSIRFAFQSNEVQQWVPSQSYIVMELSYAAGTANITDTNWKREHITDYPCNRIFARMNHTYSGMRVSSCDSPRFVCRRLD